MHKRGVAGRSVEPIGLGGAKLSLGAARPTEGEAVRTIHAALDAGVRLIDTSDVYCAGVGDTGHNERLIAKALAGWSGDRADVLRDDVLVVAKGGQYWDASGAARFDGSPAHLRSACDASLVALGVDHLDLYVLHRLPRQYGAGHAPPDETLAASVDALQALRREGKVRHVGLSNVDVAMLEQALGAGPIAALENPLSPAVPPVPEQLRFCETHGIAFLAYSPLKGTLTSEGSTPRLDALRAIAAARGISLQRATLAWELSLSPQVVPLVGARRPETILDSLRATQVELTPAELASLA